MTFSFRNFTLKSENRPKNRGMSPLNATILVSKQMALKISLVPF